MAFQRAHVAHFRVHGWIAKSAVLIALLAVSSPRRTAPASTVDGEAWLRVNAEHFIVFGNADGPGLVRATQALEGFHAAVLRPILEASKGPAAPAYAFVFRDRAAFAPLALARDQSTGDRNGAARHPAGLKDEDGLVVAAVDRNFLAFVPSASDLPAPIALRDLVRLAVDSRSPSCADDFVQGSLASDRGSELLDSFLARPGESNERNDYRAIPVSHAEWLARIGDLLAQIDPASEAADEPLHAALALDPKNNTAQLAFAGLLHARGAWDAALAWYEKALAMGGARAQVQYGWMLLDRFDAQHPDAAIGARGASPAILRARELFGQALTLAPDDPRTLHGLGRTYLFAGDDDNQALFALARAHDLHPADAEITLDLIGANLRANRINAARTLLDVDLRGCAPAAALARAERALARVEVERAAETASAGRLEEGRAILEDALDRTRNRDVRAFVAENLAQFQSASAKRAVSASFAAAAEATRKGDFESARGLYELVARTSEDPEMRRTADSMAKVAAREAARNRAAARVAKAVARANEGDAAAAIEALNAVLCDEPQLPDSMRAEVLKLRDRLQASHRRH